MMPEIDGFSVATMIKSNKRTKDIPIIFVTAKKDDDTIEKCFETGGSDYINKPFNHIELLSRVAFHLSLKEKTKSLENEKIYIQKILDLQDNIIIVSNGKEVQKANRVLLDFFQLDSVEQFKATYSCICHTFAKEDEFFHLGLVEDPSCWIEELSVMLASSDISVKIVHSDKEHIFDIHVTPIYDNFLITLMDITDIALASKELERQANYDTLTHIYNRAMFEKLMQQKIHHSNSHKKGFVCVLFDIDHFKQVNDTYGHLVGDEVLKSLSSLVQNHTRSDDIFARWGGEEFVLIFDVNLKLGVHLANSLRQIIQEHHFDTVGTVTCSFGVTAFAQNDNIDSLIERADKAMYQAKQEGRNRVCQTK
jgi:diguanylate cyclase (GGDEF)-like protein